MASNVFGTLLPPISILVWMLLFDESAGALRLLLFLQFLGVGMLMMFKAFKEGEGGLYVVFRLAHKITCFLLQIIVFVAQSEVLHASSL